ncbi:hypothetical protein Tco_0193147, partial [Tanacetum coccineum]
MVVSKDKVGLFRYLVAPDPLSPRALFPPPWDKERKEEESEVHRKKRRN